VHFNDLLIEAQFAHPAFFARRYIVTARTEKIDVDSKGKRCKEKQMTVLGQVPLLGEGRVSTTFTTHQTADVSSADDVRRLFAQYTTRVDGGVGVTGVLREWVEEVISGNR
jgi:hypothetical protein